MDYQFILKSNTDFIKVSLEFLDRVFLSRNEQTLLQ